MQVCVLELINEFGKLNKSFSNEFFYGLNPSQLGIEWIKEKMREFGIPLVDKLYELGYTTPDKILLIKARRERIIGDYEVAQKYYNLIKTPFFKQRFLHNNNNN